MKGKVAAITGGSGTLGRAFARGLAEQGVNVFTLDRNKESAQRMVSDFKAMGLTLNSVFCDVLDEASVQGMRRQVVESAGN